MAYGLNTRLFLENGPAIQAANALAARRTSGSWRRLNADSRLALVDRALTAPANDLIDAYPLAL